jgi:hypothetical protein
MKPSLEVLDGAGEDAETLIGQVAANFSFGML